MRVILSRKNRQIFNKVKYIQNQLQILTGRKKEKFYLHLPKKLMDPLTIN